MSTAVLEAPEAAVETAPETKPDPRAEAMADCQERLSSQYKTLRETEAEWEAVHTEASQLKKQVDLEQKKLNDLVGELGSIQRGNFNPRLPFPADEAATEAKPDDAWKATTLDQLKISGKLAETLTEAGLTTLGLIAAHSTAGKLLTDIPGIGEAKAEKIQAALDAWWAEHPQPSRTEESTAPETPQNAAENSDEPPKTADLVPVLSNLTTEDEFAAVKHTEEWSIGFARPRKVTGQLSMGQHEGLWFARWWMSPSKQPTVYSILFVAPAELPAADARVHASRNAVMALDSILREAGKPDAAADLAAWYRGKAPEIAYGKEFAATGLQAAARAGMDAFESGQTIEDGDGQEDHAAWCLGWHVAKQITEDTTPVPEG